MPLTDAAIRAAEPTEKTQRRFDGGGPCWEVPGERRKAEEARLQERQHALMHSDDAEVMCPLGEIEPLANGVPA